MNASQFPRRHFLRGAGGFTLALPFLPSLAPRAEAATPRAPRLVWITTDHGGAFETSMFPKSSLLTSESAAHPDHKVRSGRLVATTSNGKAVVSDVLTASSAVLTPNLIAKMNVLHGLDVPYYLGHHTGGHLGNFARNDGNAGDGSVIQTSPRPSIDQIMAWSRSFYPDLTGIRERSIAFGTSTISYSFSSPKARTGGIQAVRGTASSKAVFDRIFAQPGDEDPARKRVVDRVLQSYKDMRNGNQRLSGGDKQRLDDHVARLDELERRLTARPAPACGSVKRPDDDAANHMADTVTSALAQAELIADVIVSAFMCGSTRIATWGLGETARLVSTPLGGWHSDVAHQWLTPEKQALLVQSYQKFFEAVFLRLASRLDVDDGTGSTYLDNTLLVWSQECGMVTHEQASIPIVTFGSAAGAMKTGLYVDYRKTDDPKSSFDAGPMGYKQSFGVLYAQWLANVLQFMGLPRSEFELWGHQGYGVQYIGSDDKYKRHFGYAIDKSKYYAGASAMLPVIAA